MKFNLRKILPILLLVVMMIVLYLPILPAEAASVKYYISASTGNDKNSGSSEGSAWKTFANLRNKTFKSGDEILLKAGDSWLEQLRIDNVKGTKSNPVVLSSYGKGNKPKIARYKGKVPKLTANPIVYIISPAGLEIKGLDIGFSGVGIDLFYDNSYNNEYVKIENCDFHDIYGFNQLDYIPNYPHATSIVVTRRVSIPGTSDPSLIGLYINKCTTNDAGSLLTYGAYPINEGIGNAIKNLYMTNCVMQNNAFYGTVIADVDGGYMDNCIMKNNGSRPMPAGSMGMMVSCTNFTIMNCEISGQQRLGKDSDGGGIDFEQKSKNVTVENCYIHDNSGVGIMFFNSGGTDANKNVDCKVINCVFQNNNQNIGNVGGAEIVSIPVYSLTGGDISHNRSLETKYKFAMWIDATVGMEDNETYATKAECPWPLEKFEAVRNKVINGVPIPVKVTNAAGNVVTAVKQDISKPVYFGIGAAGGLVLSGAVIIVILLLTKKKKKAVVDGGEL